MNVENINLPCDKQDIDNIKNTDYYVSYLHYGVKNGYIDSEVAEEIVEKGEWWRVEDMMDKGDEYEPDFDINEELYSNEGVKFDEEGTLIEGDEYEAGLESNEEDE